MALLECPDCGNKISDKISSCPRCGCPIEFCELIEEPLTQEKQNTQEVSKKESIQFKRFSIGNAEIVFRTEIGLYCAMKSVAERRGSKEKHVFYEYYKNNIKNYTDIFTTAIDYIETRIQNFCKAYSQYLYELGVDCYDGERIYQYTMQHYPPDKYMKYILETKVTLDNAMDNLEQRKQDQKNMSGGWVGGGFGLSGAIKGALTASVLNAGTKMARGVVFGVGNNYTESQIYKQRQKMPNDMRTLLCLKETLYQGICNVGQACYEIFMIENNNPVVEIDEDRTVSRVKMAVEQYHLGNISADKTIETICQSISENPYWLWFYKELYEINKNNTEDILKFAETIGIEFEVARIMRNIDNGEKNWDKI